MTRIQTTQRMNIIIHMRSHIYYMYTQRQRKINIIMMMNIY